jgi:L-lactate dehydrogenase complex protein LldF
MGLEKVVEKMEEVPPLLRLLTGSATGQLITTYFNMITSPRKEGEKDGPKEVHLIILDNGRSRILSDPELQQVLQCIRCGTCMNHCPVYTRIGGHAYGFVYPGPIGEILTPQIEGLDEAGDLVSASSLCNACAEVCPVKIPIPALIRRLRNENYASEPDGSVPGYGYKKNPMESFSWKAWQLMNTCPAFFKISSKLMGLMGNRLPNMGPLKSWTSFRATPRLAPKSLHTLAREEGVDNE